MDLERITQAYSLARDAHKGQQRRFVDTPYITHLEETSHLLLESYDGNVSEEEYIAALLHDVVEDTDVEPEELERLFGIRVRQLVEELTIDKEKKEQLGKKDYLTKSMKSMTDAALTIKLCDRLSNVAGLDDHRIPKDFIVWYSKETMYILNNLDRKFTDIQRGLVDKIMKMIYYLKITKDF